MLAIVDFVVIICELHSLVIITERESGVGKLGWHQNFTGFDRTYCFVPI